MKEDGIEFVEPNPNIDASNHSYGIIPEQASPTDIIYIVNYDSDRGYLELNSWGVQRFQWEGEADKVFTKLFNQDSDIKTIELDENVDANVLVNNIKMPLTLRRAIFRTSSNGKRLQVTSRISRERARKFRIIDKKVEDYIIKCRDKYYQANKD